MCMSCMDRFTSLSGAGLLRAVHGFRAISAAPLIMGNGELCLSICPSVSLSLSLSLSLSPRLARARSLSFSLSLSLSDQQGLMVVSGLHRSSEHFREIQSNPPQSGWYVCALRRRHASRSMLSVSFVTVWCVRPNEAWCNVMQQQQSKSIKMPRGRWDSASTLQKSHRPGHVSLATVISRWACITSLVALHRMLAWWRRAHIAVEKITISVSVSPNGDQSVRMPM